MLISNPTLLYFVLNSKRRTHVPGTAKSELGSDTRYTTLSYCWGPEPSFINLTRANLQMFKQTGVPVHHLPTTFRDAITAANSTDVWARESVTMAKVHSYSSITLAAAASENAEGRLFRCRNPAAINGAQGASGLAGVTEMEGLEGGEEDALGRHLISGFGNNSNHQEAPSMSECDIGTSNEIQEAAPAAASAANVTHSTLLYRHFFPGWNSLIQGYLEGECRSQLANYRNATFSDPRVSYTVLDCLLKQFPEFRKAEMSTAAVVLGLAPTILQMISPRPSDTAMVALRRPFLALLLSVAAPATTCERLFSVHGAAHAGLLRVDGVARVRAAVCRGARRGGQQRVQDVSAVHLDRLHDCPDEGLPARGVARVGRGAAPGGLAGHGAEPAADGDDDDGDDEEFSAIAQIKVVERYQEDARQRGDAGLTFISALDAVGIVAWYVLSAILCKAVVYFECAGIQAVASASLLAAAPPPPPQMNGHVVP
ncbi:hypothetical protein PWT90_05759 [Aphanocladium album]|nr:hypothetical protein PWT90_05759 [Aphanocladium album]